MCHWKSYEGADRLRQKGILMLYFVYPISFFDQYRARIPGTNLFRHSRIYNHQIYNIDNSKCFNFQCTGDKPLEQITMVRLLS